jgi:hypothetical protein
MSQTKTYTTPCGAPCGCIVIILAVLVIAMLLGLADILNWLL